MFCAKCGTEILDNANYCPKCGNALRRDLEKEKIESLKQDHKKLKRSPMEYIHFAFSLFWVIVFLYVYFYLEIHSIVLSFIIISFSLASLAFYQNRKDRREDTAYRANGGTILLLCPRCKSQNLLSIERNYYCQDCGHKTYLPQKKYI